VDFRQHKHPRRKRKGLCGRSIERLPRKLHQSPIGKRLSVAVHLVCIRGHVRYRTFQEAVLLERVGRDLETRGAQCSRTRVLVAQERLCDQRFVPGHQGLGTAHFDPRLLGELIEGRSSCENATKTGAPPLFSMATETANVSSLFLVVAYGQPKKRSSEPLQCSGAGADFSTLAGVAAIVHMHEGRSLQAACFRELLGVRPYSDAHTRKLTVRLANAAASVVETRAKIQMATHSLAGPLVTPRCRRGCWLGRVCRPAGVLSMLKT
jgi:hypothetical protein